MTRHIQGLHAVSERQPDLPSGSYLAQIVAGRVTRTPQPRLSVELRVLEPREHEGARLLLTLSCARNHLWRVSWFLRDFSYDRDLLDRDFIDPNKLKGLRGVVRIGKQPGSDSGVRLLASAAAEAWISEAVEGRRSGEVAS
jgi:hypothetical protein